MSDKIRKGKEAEDMAADFLSRQGYEIVQRKLPLQAIGN
jgi:Holliday junction resolvase-like predicted endonuclease